MALVTPAVVGYAPPSAAFSTTFFTLGLIAGVCVYVLIGVIGSSLWRGRSESRGRVSPKPATKATRVEPSDSEPVLAALLNTLPVGVRRYDRATETVYLCPGFASLWRRDTEELAKSSDAWLEDVHEMDRRHVAHAWERALDGEPYDEKYRIRRPDGSEHWIRERACVTRDARGALSSVVFVAEDITIRRTLEEHVRRSDRLFSLSKIATGVAHDMNDPLATIVLLSQLAIHDDGDIEETYRSLRRIHAEALRCTDITRGLLQFARDDTFEKEYTELNSTVREATRLLAHHARESGTVINLTLEKDLPNLRINHVAIEQILVNLLKNSCEAGAKVIEVLTAKTKAGYRMSVEDDGSGISEAARGRIFEAFYTTRAECGSSGIGLAIAQEIVKDHDGLIHVENPPSGGTRIVVDFPESIGRRDSPILEQHSASG